MKKYIFLIIVIAFLITVGNPLFVHAAQSDTEKDSSWKLVSMIQQTGEYNVDVKVRLPKEEASVIKTFMLQFKIAGEVRNPEFVFSGNISGNKEITVWKSTYSYDDANKEGILSVYVSGRESIFKGSKEFVDLGQMKLLKGDEFKPSSAPQIQVSVAEYLIVNTFRQESVNLDYEDACDRVVLTYYEVGSELSRVMEEAEGYVGSKSGLDAGLFAGVSRYTSLVKAYERAQAASQETQAVMDQASRELSEAIEGIRPIYGLLHILTDAHRMIEGYGNVDCAELIRRYQDALEYLEKNNDPEQSELENKTRLLQFEVIVSDVRISVIKSQLSREEEGKYTEGNLTAWRNAMNAAVFLLGRRDTTEMEDIVNLKDDAVAAANDLNAAFSGLIDVTGLRNLVQRAETILSEEKKYTEKSVQNLRKAKEEAEAFLQLKSIITLDNIYNGGGELIQPGYSAVEAALHEAVSGMRERVETSETRPSVPEAEEPSIESSESGSQSPESSSSDAQDSSRTPESAEDIGVPGNEGSGTGNTGTGNAGTGNAGTGNAGTGNAGTGSTGTGNDGTGSSGTGSSGTGNSGTGNAETEDGASGTGVQGEDTSSEDGSLGNAGSNGSGANDRGGSDAGEYYSYQSTSQFIMLTVLAAASSIFIFTAILLYFRKRTRGVKNRRL